TSLAARPTRILPLQCQEDLSWRGTADRFACCSILLRRQPRCTLFPYTTLFRSVIAPRIACGKIIKRAAGKNPSPMERAASDWDRSEEHTSELQSRFDLVCRLLLEKKKDHGGFKLVYGRAVLEPSGGCKKGAVQE